jgi:hypothetical protein
LETKKQNRKENNDLSEINCIVQVDRQAGNWRVLSLTNEASARGASPLSAESRILQFPKRCGALSGRRHGGWLFYRRLKQSKTTVLFDNKCHL